MKENRDNKNIASFWKTGKRAINFLEKQLYGDQLLKCKNRKNGSVNNKKISVCLGKMIFLVHQ
jgi:hypothetical protein